MAFMLYCIVLYVNAEHQWFKPEDAESKRALTRNILEALFVNK